MPSAEPTEKLIDSADEAELVRVHGLPPGKEKTEEAKILAIHLVRKYGSNIVYAVERTLYQ